MYTIYTMDGAPIMNKNTDQMKDWLTKRNVTTSHGEKVDLRKCKQGGNGIVVSVNNEKFLRVRA